MYIINNGDFSSIFSSKKITFCNVFGRFFTNNFSVFIYFTVFRYQMSITLKISVPELLRSSTLIFVYLLIIGFSLNFNSL